MMPSGVYERKKVKYDTPEQAAYMPVKKRRREFSPLNLLALQEAAAKLGFSIYSITINAEKDSKLTVEVLVKNETKNPPVLLGTEVVREADTVMKGLSRIDNSKPVKEKYEDEDPDVPGKD